MGSAGGRVDRAVEVVVRVAADEALREDLRARGEAGRLRAEEEEGDDDMMIVDVDKFRLNVLRSYRESMEAFCLLKKSVADSSDDRIDRLQEHLRRRLRKPNPATLSRLNDEVMLMKQPQQRPRRPQPLRTKPNWQRLDR